MLYIYSLNREIHDCWIFFNKECIFCESLKAIKEIVKYRMYVSL